MPLIIVLQSAPHVALLLRLVERAQSRHDFGSVGWILVHPELHLVLLQDIVNELLVKDGVLEVIPNRSSMLQWLALCSCVEGLVSADEAPETCLLV